MFSRNTSPLLAFASLSLSLTQPVSAAEKEVPILFSEDFENTAKGQIPDGFTKDGSVGVTDEVGHWGKKSLRIEAAIRGPRRINKSGPEITALGGQHWGRLYFKVQLPTPDPSPEKPIIHSTLVGGKATSPQFNDPIEVRVLDTLVGKTGELSYLYNVQPKQRPEFATSTPRQYRYSDQWTLAEWFVDHATQTYKLFINGEEIPKVSFSKGAGAFEKSEIPEVFQSLSFGWNNYQPAGVNPGDGFVAWIDDIALGKERIGAQVIAPKKASAK
ncbi:MAG: hypothetical protein WCO60_07225 [Verrucomicrobiota bacterium]